LTKDFNFFSRKLKKHIQPNFFQNGESETAVAGPIVEIIQITKATGNADIVTGIAAGRTESITNAVANF